jgi:hypothetical protein
MNHILQFVPNLYRGRPVLCGGISYQHIIACTPLSGVAVLGTGKDSMEGMKVKEGFLDIVLLNAIRLSTGIAQTGSMLNATKDRSTLSANYKGGIHA